MQVTFHGALDPSLSVADRNPVATACQPACLRSSIPPSLLPFLPAPLFPPGALQQRASVFPRPAPASRMLTRLTTTPSFHILPPPCLA